MFLMRNALRRFAPAADHFSWRRSRVMVPVVVVVALCGLIPSSAFATATEAEINSSVSKGVTYLKGLQSEVDGSLSEWSLTALAAAHVAAADVNKSGVSGRDARSWYLGLVGAASWPEGATFLGSEYERASLAAYAAGIDPARVSSRQNLLAGVFSVYQMAAPGYFGPNFSETIFGLLALADSKTTSGVQRFPVSLLELSVKAIEANQHTDGGWNFAKVAGSEEKMKTASEPDLTGAAMAALCSAGVEASDPVIKKGKEFLASIFQKTTGSIGAGSNTNSTGWAVSGLNACGINPQGTEFTGTGTKKPTPLNFLINQQVMGGGFRHTTGSSPEVEASNAAIRALTGAGFTVSPPVPSSAPQWMAASSWGTGKTETAAIALVVEYAGLLKVCSVSVAPEATSTNLLKILEVAKSKSTPAECVTSFSALSPNLPIESINGFSGEWSISIDGGASEVARLNHQIHLGDTIYLKGK